MKWQLKKFFPIFLATLLGGAVIVVAVKGGRIFGVNASSSAPQKGSDNSWRSALSIIPGDKSRTRIEKSSVTIEYDPSLSATSTTGIISKKLLLEYSALQKKTGNAELSDSDAETIATALAREVKLPGKTWYTSSDLNISKDNSASALEAYKSALTVLANELIAANRKNARNKEDVLSVVTVASEMQNSSILEKLDPIIARHQTLAGNLLVLKTPSTATELHLRLLQSIEDLRAAMVGLQKLVADPIVGITAIGEYQKGATELYATVDEYNSFFGVTN